MLHGTLLETIKLINAADYELIVAIHKNKGNNQFAFNDFIDKLCDQNHQDYNFISTSIKEVLNNQSSFIHNDVKALISNHRYNT